MAKPTLALIPASQGSKLFSVLPSSGVGDFDFSRGSAATRINSQGLIENVASGQSRLEYPLIDGVVNGCPSVLLEPQRTNSITYSEDFSNAAWGKNNLTVSSNVITSPDGALNATKLIPNATASVNKYLSGSIAATNGINYAYSVFAKKGEYDRLRLEDGNNSSGAWFNLSNGTIGTVGGGATAKIDNYGNGWYKCTLIKPTITTSFFTVMGASNIESIQVGNGTSGIYIYGAQLEEGSYPTSYIPTNGTAVTRLAETANGAGDASTFNDSEGVLMAEISGLANDGTWRGFGISDGSTSNRIIFWYRPTDNAIEFSLSKSSVSQSSLNISINDVKENIKILVKYKVNDVSIWLNGFKVFTDTTAQMPLNLSELAFDNGNGVENFYGKTKQIQYFQTVLTDSELEQLTSWISFTDMANGQLYTIE